MYIRPDLTRINDLPSLVTALQREFDRLAVELRRSQEGRLYGQRTGTAAPTTGSHAQGDVLRNSNPANVSATPDYVLYGWLCTVAGTPGTWVELRIPTE